MIYGKKAAHSVANVFHCNSRGERGLCRKGVITGLHPETREQDAAPGIASKPTVPRAAGLANAVPAQPVSTGRWALLYSGPTGRQPGRHTGRHPLSLLFSLRSGTAREGVEGCACPTRSWCVWQPLVQPGACPSEAVAGGLVRRRHETQVETLPSV